jgi:hypothetical protein
MLPEDRMGKEKAYIDVACSFCEGKSDGHVICIYGPTKETGLRKDEK